MTLPPADEVAGRLQRCGVGGGEDAVGGVQDGGDADGVGTGRYRRDQPVLVVGGNGRHQNLQCRGLWPQVDGCDAVAGAPFTVLRAVRVWAPAVVPVRWWKPTPSGFGAPRVRSCRQASRTTLRSVCGSAAAHEHLCLHGDRRLSGQNTAGWRCDRDLHGAGGRRRIGATATATAGATSAAMGKRAGWAPEFKTGDMAWSKGRGKKCYTSPGRRVPQTL